MALGNELETPAQKVGIVIFMLPLVFCSMEMVEGWGIFGLKWPDYYYYCIMAVCGSIGGVLIRGRFWLPGLLGGSVAGVGSLAATAVVLANVNETHTIILVLVGGLGCLPGVALYWLLRFVQNSVFPIGDSETFNIDTPDKNQQFPQQ